MKRSKQKKMELTDEQKEVLSWVFYNYLGSMRELLELLLSGKGIRFPKKYINMFRNMSEQEQDQVVLILSRYFDDTHEENKRIKSIEKKRMRKKRKQRKQIKKIEDLIEKYSYL